MNFACALIRGALQVGYTDLSFSRKTSLYFIMPIPLTARISISDPALLPICHLQKVRCEPGLAYYNETTTSLNSDSSISYFLYPEHPLFAPIEDPTRHPLYHLRLPNQIRLPLLEKSVSIRSSGFPSPWFIRNRLSIQVFLLNSYICLTVFVANEKMHR